MSSAIRPLACHARRVVTQSDRSVGVASAAKLARWIATLPEEDKAVVAALQLGNEPALNSPGYDHHVKQYYTRALAAARESLGNSSRRGY